MLLIEKIMMSQNKRKALKAKGWVIFDTPDELFAELEKQNKKGGRQMNKNKKKQKEEQDDCYRQASPRDCFEGVGYSSSQRKSQDCYTNTISPLLFVLTSPHPRQKG